MEASRLCEHPQELTIYSPSCLLISLSPAHRSIPAPRLCHSTYSNAALVQQPAPPLCSLQPNQRPLGSSLCTTGSDCLVLLLPPHFLTRFHLNSVGLPHMSDWLWAAPFSPCQCHHQAGQLIPDALRLAPEFASCSVALWGNQAPTNTLGDVQLLAICTGTGS